MQEISDAECEEYNLLKLQLLQEPGVVRVGQEKVEPGWKHSAQLQPLGQNNLTVKASDI